MIHLLERQQDACREVAALLEEEVQQGEASVMPGHLDCYLWHPLIFLEAHAEGYRVLEVPRPVLLILQGLKVDLPVLMELHVEGEVGKADSGNGNLELGPDSNPPGLVG